MSGAVKPILLLISISAVCSSVYAVESDDTMPLRGLTSSTAVPAPVSATSTSATPVLQTTVAKDPAATQHDNSVESFFQVDPSKRNSAQNLLMQTATIPSTADNKSKAPTYGMYRFFWHVLDNAGIPMFFGQDPYIDPSINSKYLIPSPKLPREHDLGKELENTTNAVSQPPSQPAATNTQSTPQKIPNSELEGVNLPAPSDDVHAPAP